MTCLKFLFYFFMSNEILLFQIIYIYITCESKNSKIYPMQVMFYQWPKLPINFIFEFFYIAIEHLVFVTFTHFMYISNKVFVVKILAQKKLFKQSLYVLELFFFSRNKVLDFFQYLVGILKLV